MEVFWIAEGKAEQRSPTRIAERLARRERILWVDIPSCRSRSLRGDPPLAEVLPPG